MAMQPYSATAAAVCPEGKLEVGGARSSWSTPGRSRPTSAVTTRKTCNSPTRAATTVQDSRQRQSHSRNTMTEIMRTAIHVGVSER